MHHDRRSLISALFVLVCVILGSTTGAAQARPEPEPPIQAVFRSFDRLNVTEPNQTYWIGAYAEESETEALAIAYTEWSIQSFSKPPPQSLVCPGDAVMTPYTTPVSAPPFGDESIVLAGTIAYPPSAEAPEGWNANYWVIMARQGRFLYTLWGESLAGESLADLLPIMERILTNPKVRGISALFDRPIPNAEMRQDGLWSHLPTLSELPTGFGLGDEIDVTELTADAMSGIPICPTPTPTALTTT